MVIEYGQGHTGYGPGVDINLSGEEVVQAISAWLLANGVNISGPRTITVNDGEPCSNGNIYVDPSGYVIYDGEKISGRGHRKA